MSTATIVPVQPGIGRYDERNQAYCYFTERRDEKGTRTFTPNCGGCLFQRAGSSTAFKFHDGRIIFAATAADGSVKPPAQPHAIIRYVWDACPDRKVRQ